jgi:beta-alanine degradation protein BauB
MKSRHAYAVGALLGLAFAVLIARVHAGPQLESQRLTLRLENEKVRVLELRLKPGEQEGFHTHPQYVLYALTNYRVKNTAADGTSKVFERKAGDVFWGQPITHRGENVGDTEVHALIVELRQSPRRPSP